MSKKQWGLIAVLILLNYIILSQVIRLAVSSKALTKIAAIPTVLPSLTPRSTPMELLTATPLGFAIQLTATNTPVISISVTSGTAAPLVTPNELTATATAVVPSITTTSVLNVRSGPGTNYPVLGILTEGQHADVTGKSADGNWWQIAFAANAEGKGWVAAGYCIAIGADSVLVVQAPPPPPTPTPTNTPVPPTATLTPASAGPTATATHTNPTATPKSSSSYQYSVRNMWADQNTAITQIVGRIFDREDKGVNGVYVRVRSGDYCVVSFASGPPGGYPSAGNYDLMLGPGPRPNVWMVDVVPGTAPPVTAECHALKPLSEAKAVETTAQASVVHLEWQRNN